MKKMLFFIIFLIFLSFFTIFYQQNMIIFAFSNENNVSIELICDNKKYYFNENKFKKNPNNYQEKYILDSSIWTKTKQEKIDFVNKCIDANLSYEMAIEYIFPSLRQEIDALDRKYYIKVQNAQIDFTPNEKSPFKISPSIKGQRLDREKLCRNIFERYKKTNRISIRLPFDFTEPTFTTAQAKRLTTLRSQFSTNYSASSADRKHNVKTALDKFNGLVVSAGQKVSFNQVVGKRTQENGYKTAKIILEGEYVDGVGGGVCQASTTLYNAVLLSDLKIHQVQRHSKRVSYVPPALDAMVNWNSSDMVFENTTSHPIYIATKCTDTIAKVLVYGEALQSGLTIKTETEVVKKTAPPQEEVIVDNEGKYVDKVYYEDESFYLHYAKEGVIAKSYLVKTLNGKPLSKTLIRTEQYPPERATKVVGANKRPPIEPESIYDYTQYISDMVGW